MKDMNLNGRKVIDAAVDGVDVKDYPYFSEAYFSEAFYEDTGEELSDAELEQLTGLYAEVLNEMAFVWCT
jgi:hypothetical protein